MRWHGLERIDLLLGKVADRAAVRFDGDPVACIDRPRVDDRAQADPPGRALARAIAEVRLAHLREADRDEAHRLYHAGGRAERLQGAVGGRPRLRAGAGTQPL